jgi:serine/threonine protein kinase
MQLPKAIHDRSVLHDIFTEITCLEEFRLEPCVTDLYDYGVDSQNYYIVMKRYSGSLRDWRLKQSTKTSEIKYNLSLYLAIYKEILKCFKTIHEHKVSHYDIKLDNILIDFKANDRAKRNHSDSSDQE